MALAGVLEGIEVQGRGRARQSTRPSVPALFARVVVRMTASFYGPDAHQSPDRALEWENSEKVGGHCPRQKILFIYSFDILQTLIQLACS